MDCERVCRRDYRKHANERLGEEDVKSTARRFDGQPLDDLSSWGAGLEPRIIASSAASSYDPALERARSELLGTIRYLAVTPITWSDREPTPIDSLSAETA